MSIDSIVQKEIVEFFNDFNTKLNDHYFIEEESRKYDALENFLLEVSDSDDITAIKNKIWEQIPSELIKEGRKDKLTKKRFYCSNGTITRDELFVLAIVLKLDKKDAIHLINGLFKEMYINYANPYDLLYDYCLTKQLDLAMYMDYKKKLDLLFNDESEEFYINELENLSNVTKTHQIAKNYKSFLASNQNDIISFLLNHQQDFHYYSHYMYKLYYSLLSSINNYYKKNYLSSTTKGYTMLVNGSNAIRLTQLDRDLRYHLDNMKSYYIADNVYIDPTNWNEFFEFCHDMFDSNSALESDKTKGRSLVGIIEANKDINRSLLIMTSILCGKISEKEINELIDKVTLIRPEIEELDDSDIVDYWLKKVLDFASKAKTKAKTNYSENQCFNQVKLFMKISRVLMIIYLEQMADKKAYVNEGTKANMSLYASCLMKYFTNHTKLTYAKGNER